MKRHLHGLDQSSGDMDHFCATTEDMTATFRLGTKDRSRSFPEFGSQEIEKPLDMKDGV